MSTSTRTRPSSDLLFAVLILLLGVVALVGGLAYGLEHEDRVGPGAMPAAAGLLILIPGLLQVRKELRARRAETPGAEDGGDRRPEREPVEGLASLAAESASGAENTADLDAEPRAPQTRRVVLLFALIALSVAMTYVIGLLISVSLLVGALFVLDNPRKPWIGAVAAVIAALFGWSVFEVLLEVPLPRGFLNLI